MERVLLVPLLLDVVVIIICSVVVFIFLIIMLVTITKLRFTVIIIVRVTVWLNEVIQPAHLRKVVVAFGRGTLSWLSLCKLQYVRKLMIAID